jgi:hypothetical protein
MQKIAPSEKHRSFVVILPKLFLILAVVFSMWIVLVLSGQMFLEYSSTWAGLSLSFWLLLISVLFGAFIVIDIIIYAHPRLLIPSDNLSVNQPMSSSVEIKDGKHIYELTFPKNVKGGLFSKTYISIDEENVVRLRHQIISYEQLWDKGKMEE